VNIEIKEIDSITALECLLAYHYTKVMPRLTKFYLGAFVDGKLIGALTLGWGTRPVHTIKKLFPSLITKDYFEIGKMVMREEMPRNTESQFLSAVIKWIKNNQPNTKILFTWADGVLGKPGYVYQSANFLYGGFIFTDLYITEKGERIHPRTSQGMADKEDLTCGHRPTKDFLKSQGWKHYRGKQFRYIYFLGNKLEKKKLLTESEFQWTIDYPKTKDLEWFIQDLDTGEWKKTDKIEYDPNVITLANKKAVENIAKIKDIQIAKQFFEF
jgi:hypothetical protein